MEEQMGTWTLFPSTGELEAEAEMWAPVLCFPHRTGPLRPAFSLPEARGAVSSLWRASWDPSWGEIVCGGRESLRRNGSDTGHSFKKT